MAEVVLGAVSIVSGCLVAPVNRLCGYVISYEGDASELKAKVEELGIAKQNVKDSINYAQNNAKPIRAYVNEWVEDVEKDTEEARRVLDDDERAEKTCFYGRLPNLKVRYRLSREVRRKAKDIQRLIGRIPSGQVYDDPPPGLVDGASNMISLAGDRGDTIFESRASILKDIMNALDVEKHKVIGIYGPGGVGKTTILEEVEKKLREEGRPFHMIVKSKVSQTPDLKKIQDDIAYAFGLNLRDSEEGRKDNLLKRLQMNPSEKVLIILDDLWAELDLKAVGIPLGNESMKCKLLLTSRDKRVLEERMHADQTFRLKSLMEDEAFKLFERGVGDKLRDDEELKVKPTQVVTKLAGLPLLINSVASTLKYSDVSTWEDMLIKIEDPNNERIVKWSYDHLESEEAKCLFLLCGLIGGIIRVELLLGLGMGLGLFRGFDNKMQSSRNRLNMMLNSLHSFCLLQDGGDGKENVTIHDLYSEVVVSNVFSDQNSLMIDNNYGSWPKEKLEKCWACLVNVGSNRLVELMPRQFTHVEILMLSEQYHIEDCSRMDFTYLGELRVLYLGSMLITSLPSSMEILKNLRSLSISCHVVDVANLGKLKALQILSFVGSGIDKLPKELGKLTNLRSLNLSNCFLLRIIEPGALKGLINLEELLMKGSFDKWRGKDEIPFNPSHFRLAELKSLTKLTALEISICDPTVLSKDGDLPFGNLVRFYIKVGFVLSEYEGLRTMKLDLEWCDDILSRKWVQKTLQKTQYLHLCLLSEFKKSAHELCTQGFPELKCLTIDESPSIKYIANSSNGLPPNAFRKLESLSLKNLINLEKICRGPIALECFSKLKVVIVKNCDRLKYFWFLLDMQRLVQLEEIEVWWCDSMQSIVTHDAGKDIVSTNNRVELPKVRRLELCYLPNMTSFCTKAEIKSEDSPIQVSLPHLESLNMVGVLGLEKILYREPSLQYSNLREIIIKESKSTSKSIMKLDWMLNLPNLESMSLESSSSAELVFDLEEREVTEDVEILSRLTELTLEQLPNLKYMWKRDVKLKGISIFRNLRGLYVRETGLSFLFSVSVAKCLREIRVIAVWRCPNMKAVIVDEEGRDEGTYNMIEFPLLESLGIRQGPMEKFFPYPHGNKETVATTSYSQDANSDFFFDRKISLPNLVDLELYKVGSFKRIWHVELSRNSFCKLAKITVEKCSDLLHIFPTTIVGRLHNLQSVKVKDCPSLKSLFDFGSLDSNTERTTVLLPKLVTFPNITRLVINGPRCKELWNNQIPIDSFQKLEYLKLKNCDNLQCIATSYMWKNLQRYLKFLEVISCRSIKIIYEVDGVDMESGKLLWLVLHDLENLRCIWQSNGLPNIPFPNLVHVKAVSCPRLEMLFPTFTAKFLGQIKTLIVDSCEDMEQIAGHEKWEEVTGTAITFSNLTDLKLSKLPKFKSFLPDKYSLKLPCSEDFPSLGVLSIVSCGAEPDQAFEYPGYNEFS